MRFETLREFIIVAKHLNITKAAQELYLSQPSLSARIAALEKELGYLLFDRSQNKLALTPAGSVLLEYAQRIADLHDEALEKAQAAARRVPFGEETVLGYLYAKESELTAIRTIFAGRAAGLDGDTVRQRLRDTYV